MKAPTEVIGEPSGGQTQEETRLPQDHSSPEAQIPSEDYSLRGLYDLLKGMQEKQERHEAFLEDSLKKLQERKEAIFKEI